MDRLTKAQRSQLMSRIRSKNTKPEVLFRKFLWSKSIRGYRIHKKLKGSPDLYFGKAKLAVFIDGCFWHQCPECFRAPKTNKKFWNAKIRRNVERDLETDLALTKAGIKPLRFWEHEIKSQTAACYQKINRHLQKKRNLT